MGLALLGTTFSTGVRLSCMMILSSVKQATMSNVMVIVICPRCVHHVITSCCWWESGGVADISSGVWVGQLHQVNFIGDEVATIEFACVDLPQAGLEALWQQLPDEVEELSDLPAACTG